MQIVLKDFTKSFDGLTVIDKLNLTINDGEMLALLGPSGCGKSTTLLAISGILRVNGGQILFGDKDVSNLPSQKRNVGVVFQNYALYPHMTAFENIAFPLQVRKTGAAEIEERVREMARLTHIEPYLDRRPGQLSGGQQQRVALARALVRRPDVLLLDEPLANLDAKLRLEMRSEIRRIQLETGITAILVTHDQVEAMSMADRIAIMDHGRIQQIAAPEDMYHRPSNTFVAGFLGNPPIVFLEGKAIGNGAFESASGMRMPLPERLTGLAADQPIVMGVRPEHFGVKGRHTVRGTVSFIEPQGRETHFDLTVAEGEVLRSIQAARTDISLGSEVEWPLDVDKALVFDSEGNRL
ncbi:ABC transporter ATP-binding protein [Pelagibacterium xiamenense]|uniref:ABC transporter ATP-binding protein n=1 Tax=Pelagibacterium xiamenense TaxID=2901140 RepID=UPI001E42922F|nr:ABC transporter ATP-binding protein [Pelagibacterium xiamenense]MCD7060585.1 ABC transporter ATP-binding protein [Pelagibacterium xiamenense]